MDSDLSETNDRVETTVSIIARNVERLLRRYARRSRQFRVLWETTPETENAAQIMLMTLLSEAIALMSAEGSNLCPYFYVLTQLDLSDQEMHPITVALANILVQCGLATFKEELWRDLWESRDAPYNFRGAIGEPLQYVILTEAGKEWATTKIAALSTSA